MNTTTTQKINKDKEDLNNTIKPRLHRYLQNSTPNNSRIRIFLNEHGAVPRVDYILCHEKNFNKGLKSYKVYSPTTMESDQKSVTERILGNL